MKKVLIALIVAALAGCGGGGDESAANTAASPLDKFVGAWKVTYSGGDRGECTLNVPVPTSLIEAAVSGTCKSNLIGVTFAINGTIDNIGGVTVGQPFGNGFYLSGSMTGSRGDGTWRTRAWDTTAFGTWTAAR